MAKSYRRHAKGGSFKKQSFGDLGLRSYKDQQDRIIDSLKLQQTRAAEYNKDYERGISNVAKNEQENRRLLKNLEDDAYQTRRKAIETRAKNEVSFLESQADEAARKSDFWVNFSTTYAKQYGQTADKLIAFGQRRSATEYWKKRLADNPDLNKFTDLTYDTADSIIDKENLSLWKNRKNPDNAEQIAALTSKEHKTMFVADTFQNQWDVFKRDRRLGFENAGGKWDLKSATKSLLDGSISWMIEAGIRPDSKGGVKIYNFVKQKISAETIKLHDAELVNKSERDIKELLNIHLSNNTDATYNALVTRISTSYQSKGDKVAQPYVDANGPNYAIASLEANRLISEKGYKDKFHSYSEYENYTHNHKILATSHDGDPVYGDKRKSYIERNQHLTPDYEKIFADVEDKWNQNKPDVSEEVSDKQAEFQALISTNRNWRNDNRPSGEATEENIEATMKEQKFSTEDEARNYLKGGIATQLRKAIADSNDINFRKWGNAQLGYDRSKHNEMHIFQELTNPFTDPIRKGYLFGGLNEDEQHAYLPYYNAGEALIIAGETKESIDKYFGNEIIEAKQEGLQLVKATNEEKDVITAAVQQFHYELTLLSNPDTDEYVKNERERIQVAKRKVKDDIEEGRTKGTGTYAAIPSGTETDKGFSKRTTWLNFKNPDTTGGDLKEEDVSLKLLGDFTLGKENTSLDALIKSEYILSADEISYIAESIRRGEYNTFTSSIDKKLGLVVKTSPIKINKSDLVQRILNAHGYDEKVPADSYKQLKTSGIGDQASIKNPRNMIPMLAYFSTVNQSGKLPEPLSQTDKWRIDQWRIK